MATLIIFFFFFQGNQKKPEQNKLYVKTSSLHHVVLWLSDKKPNVLHEILRCDFSYHLHYRINPCEMLSFKIHVYINTHYIFMMSQELKLHS